MILIFSQKDLEPTTEDVQDWLDYYNAKSKRVNGEDFLFSIDDFNDKDFISSINVCWFRRWGDFSDIKHNFLLLDNRNYCEIEKDYNSQNKVLIKYLFHQLKDKKWLTHLKELSYTKLEQLTVAEEVGMNIPKTIVTASKERLKAFIAENGEVITKVLTHSVPRYYFGQTPVNFKTILVNQSLVEKLEDTFFPSLFQVCVQKQYELRVFFLEKEMYAMAIFSQNNPKTQVDFRNYDKQKPNRTVPYILPIDIKQKILQYIEKLNLTTGSIDFIKSKKGEYIFLEVNPVGQFGMVSYPCNYYLEEKTAKFLIKNDRTIQ